MKLDGPSNVRELGGYPTLEGKLTRHGQFLRSDNPASLSPGDCDLLYRYGVRAQIDLRSDFECKHLVSRLKRYKDIFYCNIPLLDNLHSNQGNMQTPDSLGEVYIALLDHAAEEFASIFRLMLRYPDDCVLFNCTAGKDRTGTIAMLLLKAAHCPNDVIVADYAATYANIQHTVEESLKFYRARGLEINKALMRSDPVEMEKALEYLGKTYSTIENWFAGIGLTEEEIGALRRKLVG